MSARLPLRADRRTLLRGAAGVSVVAGLGGATWYRFYGDRFDGVAGSALPQPEVLTSVDGVLDVSLTAALGSHRIAGRTATTFGYNGGVPGPTLALRPGDRLRIALTNDLAEPTNLHVHGLHVSPSGSGDDVFVSLEPGETRQYDYTLPANHPAGVGWYHPHRHGFVAGQVSGGLFGAILVDDDSTRPADSEVGRVMIVHDMALSSDGSLSEPSEMSVQMGRTGDLVMINGALEPEIGGAPGSRERWSIINASSSRYATLTLPPSVARVTGRDMTVTADGGASDTVELAPGNRLALDVVMPEESTPLQATFRTGDTGMGMMDSPDTITLAQLIPTSSTAGGSPPPVVDPAPSLLDLREVGVDERRTIVFGPSPGSMMAAHRRQTRFDGQTFDPDRVDQQVAAGAVEEWTLRNETPMDHPFHLHVWPMQVVSIAGEEVPEARFVDVVDVPRGEEVVVRIAFDDYTGRTVYHCHILDHEDRGMMGTVEVG